MNKNITVTAALAAFALTGCTTGDSDNAPSPTAVVKTVAITGQVRLKQPAMAGAGIPCDGHSGYDDIHGGAPIIITDGTGKTVATSRLQQGETFDNWAGLPGADECRFLFTAAVPDGHDFYRLVIGARRPVMLTRMDMESPIVLTLGGGRAS